LNVMIKRKYIICLFVLFAILGISLVVYIQQAFNAFYQEHALKCVGVASLLYIRDTGNSPRDLDDLLEEKYLVEDTDYGVTCGGGIHAHWKYISKIQLGFSLKAEQLKLDHGRLVEKTFNQERFLVVMVPHTPYLVDLYTINKWIWERWVKIERGEPINEDWFKIKIQKTESNKSTATKSVKTQSSQEK